MTPVAPDQARLAAIVVADLAADHDGCDLDCPQAAAVALLGPVASGDAAIVSSDALDLLRALVTFTDHDRSCQRASTLATDPTPACTCGLDALRGQAAEMTAEEGT